VFPDAQPPPSMPEQRTSASVQRYPNTEALARDTIESQGYSVNGITQQSHGSWQVGVNQDAVPTRPQGAPSRVTIFPDGRTAEELE
jgi:hypothetical protein